VKRVNLSNVIQLHYNPVHKNMSVSTQWKSLFKCNW